MRREKKAFYFSGTRRYLTVGSLTDRVYIVLPRQTAPANESQRKLRREFPGGAIIIMRRDRNGNRVPQLYRSIHGAIRSRLMARVRYGAGTVPGESEHLVEVVWDAKRSLEMILGREAVDQFEKSMVQARLQEMASKLERSHNIWKQSAFEAIDAASDLHDSLGRNNPGAKAARISSGVHKLRMRVMEIPLILSFVTEDEVKLLEERFRHLLLCERLLKRLELVLASPIMQKPEKYRAKRSEKLDYWINDRVREFQGMNALPYTKARYHGLRDLAAVRRYGNEGDWLKAGRALRRIACSLELLLIQPRLEDSILKLNAMMYIQSESTKWSHAFIVDSRRKLGAFLSDLSEHALTGIDDSAFRKRVVPEIARLLKDAARRLRENGDLQLAKDALKKASSLI